ATGRGNRAGRARQWIYRHSLVVRVCHWINVVCMTILLMSGLQIFNAHPALYWGNQSDFSAPLMELGAAESGGRLIGVTTIFRRSFDTTGILGASIGPDGQMEARGFPSWATLPSGQWLAMGRLWHFFFAWIFVINGALYLLYGLISGHIRRGFVPSLAALRRIGRTAFDHLRLRFPEGEEAKRYNVLQQITYLVVIFVLVPVLILAGLAMSPRLDAGFPWLPAVFGGRQSARTVHFICAFSLLGFVVIHLIMGAVSGVWNNLRSMVTGWYAIADAEDGREE
ncbi:MAG: cytochrome b/b6 domain-containing protein, partial [Stellaceae bacterium]